MNGEYRYGYKEKIFSFIDHYQTITPALINDFYYKDNWHYMSRFEKLCWYWMTLNEYALKSINDSPCAKFFYFEDLFKSEVKTKHIRTLIEFVLGPKKSENLSDELINKAFAKKVNQGHSYKFPQWYKWDPKTKMQFKKICQNTMSKLGYGYEADWQT